MLTFDNDERGYLNWVSTNPNGFVVNATKGKGYAMMHKTSCRSISGSHPNYTTNQYMKACSLDREELIRWGEKKEGKTSLCKVCAP